MEIMKISSIRFSYCVEDLFRCQDRIYYLQGSATTSSLDQVQIVHRVLESYKRKLANRNPTEYS
jgi:hypothetical protein